MADVESKTASSVRLYSKAKVLGLQRNRHYQVRGTSLVKIEGVNTKEDTAFYLGKRVAYVYRASRATLNKGHHDGKSKIRCIWGKVTRSHGNSGVVRAQFRVNLPPKVFGASVRVMLYPSRV